MALSYEVCIRGGGIVGRTLALLLAGARVPVALVAPDAGAVGQDVRAYALNAASKQLLDSLRAWPDAVHATMVREMIVEGDEGGRVHFSASQEQADALAWIVDVPALELRLAEAVRFQPLIEVVAAPVGAALTVVCEGKASTTRQMLGVHYQVMRYPHHAVAARLRADRPHSETARQWFSERGEILALLPMGAPGGHEVALVWSVDPSRAPALLALPAEEFANAVSEASHNTLGALTLTSKRAAWPLQRATADRWVGRLDGGGAWALAGDAAHTMHPLAGQGLNAGLADVAALARILREREQWRSVGDVRLLRRYERERRAGLLPMSLAVDALQQLFSHKAGPLPQLRNWGMRGFDRLPFVKRYVVQQAMGLG